MTNPATNSTDSPQITPPSKQALEPVLAEMGKRWADSGIPGLYVGRNGPVSRERAINIRAFLYPKPKLPRGKVEQLSIPGPAGAMPAVVHWPHHTDGSAPVAPLGTMIYFHGGGFVVGDLDSHEMHAVRIANEANLVVINVAYRLAPEDPFPAAPEDAIAALRWVAPRLGQFGGQGKALCVGGDSAGGNLSAVAAVAARDEGIALAAQFLLYPGTDLRQGGDPDVNAMYMVGRQAEFGKDWRASPVIGNLKSVAPAILGVGAHDFFYQDNLAFAAALRSAGVPLIFREFPTLNHGFFSFTAVSEASLKASQSLCLDLRQLLAK